MAALLQGLVRRCCPASWRVPAWSLHKRLGVHCISTETEGDGEVVNLDQEKYKKYVGKVAQIMGANPDTFTEKDLKDSLEYLFPTALFDRKARPVLMNTSPLATAGREVNVLNENNRPRDPGFFTGLPAYHNLKFKIFKIWEASLTQPVKSQSPLDIFNKKEEVVVKPTIVKKKVMEELLSEELTDKQYEDISHRLCELSTLENNEDVQELLRPYQVPVLSAMKHLNLKKHEKPVCCGSRKAAYAQVKLTLGAGQITVNNRALLDYFPRLQDRLQIIYPLQVYGMLGQYDVKIHVKGGGMTGQAGAIRLGLSRCIASLPNVNMSRLFTAGLLTTDTRKVERKKPGQKKARKKFAWVKR